MGLGEYQGHRGCRVGCDVVDRVPPGAGSCGSWFSTLGSGVVQERESRLVTLDWIGKLWKLIGPREGCRKLWCFPMVRVGEHHSSLGCLKGVPDLHKRIHKHHARCNRLNFSWPEVEEGHKRISTAIWSHLIQCLSHRWCEFRCDITKCNW